MVRENHNSGSIERQGSMILRLIQGKSGVMLVVGVTLPPEARSTTRLSSKLGVSHFTPFAPNSLIEKEKQNIQGITPIINEGVQYNDQGASMGKELKEDDGHYLQKGYEQRE
ncbi:hypothetical protein FXO37_19385 [Capsicum annuum]|nr:hypothetical protein FXO37_19385 [Capsicum annuum]